MLFYVSEPKTARVGMPEDDSEQAVMRDTSQLFSSVILSLFELVQKTYAHGYSQLIRGAFHEFGSKSVLIPPVRLQGVDRISIGHGVYIGASSWLNVIESSVITRPAITIGNNVSVSGMLAVSAVESVVIGDDVLIARNVYMADHSHQYTDPHRPVRLQGVTSIGPIIIGK